MNAISMVATLICFASLVGSATAESSEFEVASVRPSAPGGRHGVWTNGSPNHIQMLGLNLKELVEFAYDVEGYRVSAQGPILLEPYDIIAKIPDDVAKLSEDARWLRIHVMTQTLLTDRFKLGLHRESREISVYRLGIAKSGSKIRELGPSQHENVVVDRRRGHLSAQQMPMSQLVDILTREMRRPVVDGTGIKGVFDITLDWAPDMPGGATTASNMPDTRPSLFTAVQEQLGLKLEAAKTPMEVLVVDHAERASEN